METCRVGTVDLHYAAHDSGTPVVVLHGAGVDHREPEGCFDPMLERYGGLRRIYPDLPGMGETPAPATLACADDVLDVMLGLVDDVAGNGALLLIGHSAGAYYARAVAAQRAAQVAGLALVCPLLPTTTDVPPHRPVVANDELGDEEFRSYFVIQTPEMLDRYRRLVAPGAKVADVEAMERIGEHWELTPSAEDTAYAGPTLLVAGRRDSTVGYAATVALLDEYSAATLAVLDDAGHALPHEQPDVLEALMASWLGMVSRRS